ncbi:RibD family protein [Microcoleus sp. EPA2]|uniref:RibD family protein n=1 Tax=Microcoleus sp. EPA2 TaxID=2841654 RepID=UPI00312B2BD3
MPHTTVILAMSADGKITDSALTAARFGSANDKSHLEQQVAASDAVLFGNGTLRAYGTTLRVTSPDSIEQRKLQGKPPQPVQIVCSRSRFFDPNWRFFQQPVPRWLLTGNDSRETAIPLKSSPQGGGAVSFSPKKGFCRGSAPVPTPATNDPMRVWGFQGRHGGTAPTENETALPQGGGLKSSPQGGGRGGLTSGGDSGGLTFDSGATSLFDRTLIANTIEGEIDWIDAFQQLEALGIKRLAILGGGKLVASVLAVGLIDELWLTVCPLILGGADAPTPVEGKGFLADLAPKLELLAVKQVGGEVFLHYRCDR